jgi:hypothetical protein
MVDRAGTEEAAVGRLTDGIEPNSLRAILADCLRGGRTPAGSLLELFQASDLGTVRTLIDQITLRAATISRSGDNLVRDRADDLTQLFVETEAGCVSGEDFLIRLGTN